jgi:hypothetical protein
MFSGLLLIIITRGGEILRDKTIRSILVGYKNNTICCILKPDKRITGGIAVKIIKRIL